MGEDTIDARFVDKDGRELSSHTSMFVDENGKSLDARDRQRRNFFVDDGNSEYHPDSRYCPFGEDAKLGGIKDETPDIFIGLGPHTSFPKHLKFGPPTPGYVRIPDTTLEEVFERRYKNRH